MKKITKKTNISQLVSEHPELVEILVQDYSLHCVGCAAAAFENLEQGAKAHGMNDKQIDEMIKKLNKKKK